MALMREKGHHGMVTMTVDRNRCSRYLATVLGKEHESMGQDWHREKL